MIKEFEIVTKKSVTIFKTDLIVTRSVTIRPKIKKFCFSNRFRHNPFNILKNFHFEAWFTSSLDTLVQLSLLFPLLLPPMADKSPKLGNPWCRRQCFVVTHPAGKRFSTTTFSV